MEKEELVYIVDTCISYFSEATIRHHDQGSLFGHEVPEGKERIMGGSRASSGWHRGRNRKLRAHTFKRKHEAEDEQEAG